MRNRVALASLTLLLFAAFSAPLAAQDTTSYLISWEPSAEPDVTHYIVYRSLSPADPDPTPLDTLPSSTLAFVDASALKGNTYFYRIKARNSSGVLSMFSNTCSAVTVPQNASASLNSLCDVTQLLKTGESSYEVGWSTAAQTIGFVQYDRDATLDSMSAWDDDSYVSSHQSPIGGLVAPSMYLLRAVAYDASDNMFISATDTLYTSSEPQQPLEAPHLSIYPVPYRPLQGVLNLVDLPAGGSVTILSGDGLEVWNSPVGAEPLAWDGMNSQGSPVMSGVYFVIVRDESGAVVEKRPIMIVR